MGEGGQGHWVPYQLIKENPNYITIYFETGSAMRGVYKMILKNQFDS